MGKAYRLVKRGCGFTAAVSATGYILTTAMAASDGVDSGIEVPPVVRATAMMLIICTTIGGGAAWLIERAHRIAAETLVRPIVRAEVERALADALPLYTSTVANAVGDRVGAQLHEVAVAAGRQSAVRLHDMITQDIREILTDAHRRALVTGQRMQAVAAGEAIGRAALRSVPQSFMSTLED